MADLTSSNVTILDHWTDGGLASKRQTVIRVEAVITAAGAGSIGAKIPASAFGLTKVEEVSPLVNDGGDLIVVGAPNYDGSEIVLKAAATNALASYTDTFRFEVKGY